mmetsp:Transcript_28631/g.75825  ORF Transcript_28631/g.75825 Transcript_28631/m.75825 type:complete len:285 (+) Transcript_28631:856-1710(+)
MQHDLFLTGGAVCRHLAHSKARSLLHGRRRMVRGHRAQRCLDAPQADNLLLALRVAHRQVAQHLAARLLQGPVIRKLPHRLDDSLDALERHEVLRVAGVVGAHRLQSAGARELHAGRRRVRAHGRQHRLEAARGGRLLLIGASAVRQVQKGPAAPLLGVQRRQLRRHRRDDALDADLLVLREGVLAGLGGPLPVLRARPRARRGPPEARRRSTGGPFALLHELAGSHQAGRGRRARMGFLVARLVGQRETGRGANHRVHDHRGHAAPVKPRGLPTKLWGLLACT